jgi:hypothetical protein
MAQKIKIIAFDKGVKKMEREAKTETIATAVTGHSFTEVNIEFSIGGQKDIEDLITFLKILEPSFMVG